MKNLIIIVGTVVLGCLLFNMIAGEKDSLRSSSAAFMKETVEIYEEME